MDKEEKVTKKDRLKSKPKSKEIKKKTIVTVIFIIIILLIFSYWNFFIRPISVEELADRKYEVGDNVDVKGRITEI